MELTWIREPGPDQRYASPVNKHDIGYKYLLSSKTIFIQLLRSFIRHNWVQQVDEQCIMRLDKSFILQDFAGKEADLVYRLTLNDSELIFYLLLELQAKVDFAMPYRLLLYMVEIWRSLHRDQSPLQVSNKNYRLPVIVPCVLYNGKAKWTACRRFGDYQDGFPVFRNHALDFEYILIDINRYSDEELLQLSNVIGAAFFMEKQGNGDVLESLQQLAGKLQNQDTKDVQTFLTWLIKVLTRDLPETDEQEMRNLIQGTQEVSSMISNVSKKFRKNLAAQRKQGMEQGMKQGMEQGIVMGRKRIANNLLKTGLDIEQVAKATELSIAEVKAISDELGG